MNPSYTAEELNKRLSYIVLLKQFSCANARGYRPYLGIRELGLLWGYDNEEEITTTITLINVMFNTYIQDSGLNEDYYNQIREQLPSVLLFMKETDHLENYQAYNWLISIILKPDNKSNELVINEESYNLANASIQNFINGIQPYYQQIGKYSSVWVELYNPLIYQGLAPMKSSAISGIEGIRCSLMNRFRELSKITEVSAGEMIALISEHPFSPKLKYLGSVSSKDFVDDIHKPTMSETEITQEINERINIILANIPNATIEKLESNNAKYFRAIDPLGPFAKHYGLIEGDLVELTYIMTSDRSMSSHKTEIHIVS